MPNVIDRQSNLDLNGPILSFTTHPDSVSACPDGSATFIGIATATFPTQIPSNPASGTGYISYRWHLEGYGQLSDGDLNGMTVVGSATTTLSLSNIPSAILFNNSKFFLRADYVPSAYSHPPGSDVDSTTTRSTGNAINDPLDSNIAVLTVFRNIEIIHQPAIINVNPSFSSQYATVRIRDNAGLDTTINSLELDSYSNFIPGKEYTITTDKDVFIKAFATGAGGGYSSNHRQIQGGLGGYVEGSITLYANKVYKLIVGGKGGNNGTGGYGGGGTSTTGRAGGGGGYTGLFLNSVSKDNAILIAGGGGGGANDPAVGGAGGGTRGGNAENYPSGRGGRGATQSSGYDILQGGSAPGGGGGGGYYGGFGGPNSSSGCCEDGAGGGGSGYINQSLVKDGSFTATYKTSTFTHIFDNSYDVDYLLSSSNSQFQIISRNKGASDGIGCAAQDYSKYYSIKFSNPYSDTSYEIEVYDISLTTAGGGGSSSMTVSEIKNKTNSGFDVWFCKNGTYNSYVRSFSVRIKDTKLNQPHQNGTFKMQFFIPFNDSYVQNDTINVSTSAKLESLEPIENTPSDVINYDINEVQYQWQLNEVDLVDGESSILIPKNNSDYSTNVLLRIPLWDKNSGSLVLEDLSNVPNTIINNGVRWISSGGKFYDGHAYFDENSYLQLTPISDFNFGIGDFTVETWVYFTQTGWNDIFSTGSYGQNQLSIRKNASSQLISSPGSEQLEVYYNNVIIASGGTFRLNTWQHVAVSRKSGIIRLFIDGIQVASAQWSQYISSSTPCLIGRTSGNVYNMVGRMQDFQVYGIAKYTTNFTPSNVAIVDKRLVLSLPLWDEGTGTLSLTDLSPNAKTITPGSLYGQSPFWTKNLGKFYAGAAYFNGNTYLNVQGSSDFNFGTGDFTIECWVNFQTGSNPSPVGPYEVLVNVGGGYYGDGGTWFSFVRNSTGGATFYIANVSGYASIGIVNDLKLGTWRHLAVSKQGTNVRFYVDGQYVGQRIDSSSYGGNALGYIGLEHATFHDQGYYFPFCYMQDIKIYKGLAKYTSNFTPDQFSIVSGTSQYVNVTTKVSGAKTPNLSITLPNSSNNLLRAKITHPTSCNSPLYTNSIKYNVSSDVNRSIVGIEAYTQNSSTCTLGEFDLNNVEYTITSDSFDSDTICLYAKEKDLYIEMEMFGSKGSDYGDYSGGEGGYSKIRFKMNKNEEYIIRGIKSKSSLFLYRKAQLIACVGQGGSAGRRGNGGAGGGVNVAGGTSPSPTSRGGALIQSGTMTGNGIFGSSSSVTLVYREDSIAQGSDGGRTISCSKGVYWRQLGKSACEDVGVSKFILSDGVEVVNSATILRGFKDGYCINQTAGKGETYSGNGGNGATGGTGGINYGGGGGGSGYNDTSVTVVSSTLGGNGTRQSKIVVRIYDESLDNQFYTDSAGRILILSAATAGKDPRTLTKTTGKVLPGTDTCIDDARWQNFIELAKTQNYRIVATLDGSTTPVTKATDFNLNRMINSNFIKLKTSLTDWEYVAYSYPFYCLAWDEDNATSPGYGLDYSILSWGGTSYYYGYYGQSTNSFFSQTTYSNTTANWWILPPGVPDFS